jgi:tRNA-binding EMAP/Myf-like protein
MADISQYKVGIVLSAENKGSSGQKPLKVCSVDVGADDGEPIAVVTSAINVREGSRCVSSPPLRASSSNFREQPMDDDENDG